VRGKAECLQIGHSGENVFRNEVCQKIHGDVGGAEADCAGGKGEDESFGDELAK
jgi:hypothetical protein